MKNFIKKIFSEKNLKHLVTSLAFLQSNGYVYLNKL